MTPEKDVKHDSNVDATNPGESDEQSVETPGKVTVRTIVEDAAQDAAQDAASAESATAENSSEQAEDQAQVAAVTDADDHGSDATDGEAGQDTDDSPETLETLAAKLAAAEEKAADNYDRLLRLQAEMENQRKRSQKEVSNARKFAVEGLVNDLLPVKDSLEMGLTAATAEDADLGKIIEGSDLTLKMLAQAFEKYNIVEIDPTDEKFDPEFHQAMSMQEVEGKATNTVTNVLQKGYTLNDRLIRPALVMVAK